MAKTQKSITQAASKSSAKPSFLEVMASTPEFKRLNPHIRLVNGKFESVPAEPPQKVAPLPDPGGIRRAAAVREVILQMADIFTELIDRVEDSEDVVMVALMMRAHDLNSALMNRMDDQISTRGLEGLVRHGVHPEECEEVEIETQAHTPAKSKTAQRARKVAATA